MNHHPQSPDRGFSLLELLFVVGLIGVISVIAVPMMGNTLGFFRLAGDSRNISNQTAVAKMRAASEFTRVRLYADLSAKTFRIETWDKVPANCTPSTLPGCWKLVGGDTTLSTTVSFGVGSVATGPSGTAILQAPQCLSDADPPVAINNTACIMFNSRGVPIDSTGAPTAADNLYLTDGTAVYGINVAATGMIRMYRTNNTSTPNWVKN